MSSSKSIYHCDECTYFSIRQYDIKRHSQIHGGKFKCEDCQSTFKTNNSLNLHINYCFGSNAIRGKESSSQSAAIKKDPDEEISTGSRSGKDPEEQEIEEDLLMSLKSITECDEAAEVPKKSVTTKKPKELHKCPDCHYKSERIYDMKRHSLIHGGLHKCGQCSVSFNTIIGYKNHLKFHNQQAIELQKAAEKKKTSTERFSCPICPQTFTILKNLKRHQKFHSDFKMYECSYCSASFKRKDYHLDHERRHLNSTRLRVTKNKKIKTDPDEVKFNRQSVEIESYTKPIATASQKQSTSPVETEFASTANTILDDFNDDEFLGLLEEIKSQPDASERYQDLDDVESAPNVKKKRNDENYGHKISPRNANAGKKNQNNYGCGECDLNFKSNSELWEHLKVQHFL